MKKRKVLAIAAGIAVASCTIGLVVTGWMIGWGPFGKLHDVKMTGMPGNDKKYALENIKPYEESVLKGKKIIFLGSSVTYGSASLGVSFADYISTRNGCEMIKEAVSGTTLVDNGANSYVQRLQTIEAENADVFVCQLSTNDATKKLEIGSISESKDIQDFDTSTVAGAMEYIIAYAKDTWNCPVVFYTNSKYDSEDYEKLVELTLELKEKWNICVIDLWNDAEFNDISSEQRALYMNDNIHPTQAGYLEWWTPAIEKELYKLVEN